jgi:hypothetical protein
MRDDSLRKGELQRERTRRLKYHMKINYDIASSWRKILDFELVDHAVKTFAKIGRKMIVEKTWFTDPVLTPSFDSLGGAIAKAEILYFLGKLRRNTKVEVVQNSELDPVWLQNTLESIRSKEGRISILGSFYTNRRIRIKTSDKRDRPLNEIQIGDLKIPLLETDIEVAGDNVAFVNSESCSLQYQVFPRESLTYSSDAKNTLHIRVKPQKDRTKMGIQAYSMMKLTVLNDKLAKVFSIEDSMGSQRGIRKHK